MIRLEHKIKENSMFPDMVTSDPHLADYNKLVNLVNSNRAIYITGNVPSLKNGKQIFQMNTGKSACCNAEYQKLPDLIAEDGKKTRQYLCSNCNNVSSILGKRATLVPSNTHKKYKEATTGQYLQNKKYFKTMVKGMSNPIYLAMYFIRDTSRSFDLDNAASTILDLLRDNGWIIDDSADLIIPVFLGYHIDKRTAGVIITTTNSKPIFNYDSIPNSFTHDSSNDIDDLLSI